MNGGFLLRPTWDIPASTAEPANGGPTCTSGCKDSELSTRDPWLCMLYIGDYIHPRKLTWNPKIEVRKMIFPFKGMIFRFYASFGGCILPSCIVFS